MATADTSSTNQAEDRDKLRLQWLDRLSALVNKVRDWAEELDWSTRQIEKKLEDSLVGSYRAPALLLQKETVRIILDPIARSSIGTEGVVDLYLMPAYHDIASLFFYEGGWHLHHESSTSPAVDLSQDAEEQPFSKDVLERVLEALMRNAA